MPAIICPNKNDPAWKKLVADLGGGKRGEAKAYIAFFRNGDKIPNVETARALLFRKAPMPTAPEPETKPAAAPSPAPKHAPEQILAKSKLVKATVPKATIQFRRAIKFAKPYRQVNFRGGRLVAHSRRQPQTRRPLQSQPGVLI